MAVIYYTVDKMWCVNMHPIIIILAYTQWNMKLSYNSIL